MVGVWPYLLGVIRINGFREIVTSQNTMIETVYGYILNMKPTRYGRHGNEQLRMQINDE